MISSKSLPGWILSPLPTICTYRLLLLVGRASTTASTSGKSRPSPRTATFTITCISPLRNPAIMLSRSGQVPQTRGHAQPGCTQRLGERPGGRDRRRECNSSLTADLLRHRQRDSGDVIVERSFQLARLEIPRHDPTLPEVRPDAEPDGLGADEPPVQDRVQEGVGVYNAVRVGTQQRSLVVPVDGSREAKV